MERVGDLEIEQDLDFQRREWTLERVGWFGLAVVVVLGAMGLFGHGPISWTSASADDGSLEVSFERFGRRGGSQELIISAPASGADGGTWGIELSHEYLAAVTIDSTVPEPASTEAIAGGVRYTFEQAQPDADLEVTFTLTPSGLWSSGGEVRLVGGQPITIEHFLFP